MPKDANTSALLGKKSRARAALNKHYPVTEDDVKNCGSCSGEVDPSLMKDWDDIACPICIESPHNAILLLCTSYDKGCRPYMCNTSRRHSNCFDQYIKSKHSQNVQDTSHASSGATENRQLEPGTHFQRNDLGYLEEQLTEDSFSTFHDSRRGRRPLVHRTHVQGSEISRTDAQPEPSSLFGRSNLSHEEQPLEDLVSRYHNSGRSRRPLVHRTDEQDSESSRIDAQPEINDVDGDTRDSAVLLGLPNHQRLSGLMCPLCRGTVKGWKEADHVRQYLNSKARNCSQEGCPFSGNYDELRKHARSDHPLARPSDVDPVRQRAWRRLERQTDIGDVLSTIRSSFHGAPVVGDYVIDNDDMEDDSDFAGDDGQWLTVLLLFQVFRPLSSSLSQSGRYRRGSLLPSNSARSRHYHWGSTHNWTAESRLSNRRRRRSRLQRQGEGTS